MRSTLEMSLQTQLATSNPSASSILMVAQADLSQLVAVRLTHQTKCAAKSVKTRENPKGAITGLLVQTDRQKLCVQMAEVVR